MPGEPTPVEVAVGRFKARYDRKVQLQGEVETLRKATVELKRKVDDHVALEAQEQVDAEEEEWEEIEVEEGELLDGIDTEALSERELTSLQAAVPKYPVLAEEIADLEQQLRHTRRLKEVLVKALKEHGSKGRLKLPGKAKAGAKQAGLLPPPKAGLLSAPKEGLLPPPSIKPPTSVSRESSGASQGEGLLRRPSSGEGLLKPPSNASGDVKGSGDGKGSGKGPPPEDDAMDVDTHVEVVPSGKRKEAPPEPVGREAAPPPVGQGEDKPSKKARADSPRRDDDDGESTNKGGDVDELDKEVSEIWDRIKHEPFKEAKAFQIMFNRYVLIDKLQRAPKEELESNVERMVRLLVRCNKHERRRIASHHACTRIIATYKRRMMHLTDEQRLDKADELLAVPTSMNTETGTMLAVVVTLILRLCSEELYTGLFLDLVLDRLCPQVYRLRTTLDLLLSPDGPSVAPPFAHEESAQAGEEDEGRWEVGSSITTTSTSTSSVSLYQWGLKEARASHAVTLLFTVLCRKAREPDRVRSLLHDLLAMAGGGMGAVAPVSAILRTWPSVLKSRYSYMGRLVPRLLAEGIHRASAALSEQAGVHEEEDEKEDKEPDSDKGRERERERGGDRRKKAEAKRPEAHFFQRACEDVYRRMCDALECPIPASLSEDRQGDKGPGKEEGVEALVPELLKGVMEGEDEGQISEAVRALELVAAAQPITWLDETLQKHGYSDQVEAPQDEDEEEEEVGEEEKQRRRVAERVMRLRAGLARELTSRAAIAAGGGLLPTLAGAQGMGEGHTDISAHVQFIRDLTRRFLQAASVAFRPVLSCTTLAPLASHKPLTSLPLTYVNEGDQEDDMALVQGQRGEGLCMGYWALLGLACMPGQELGNLKEAMEPLRRLREKERNVIPDLVLRAVLNSQRRPHCIVLTNREGGQVVGGLRESEAQEWMVQQAVFHDLSFKMVNPQTLPLLLKSEQRWEAEWGRQKGSLDRDHVALWHLYSTKRLTALDYTTDCPPELVVLEGGVVGHPNLGPDLRNLIQELRHRDKDWDMLTLAFALPPKREWHRDGDDGRRGHVTRGEFAEVAPKGTYISSSAYILSLAGACKLLRHWARFESVEACFNSLVTAPHFSVLIPGEAAEVFHVDHDHPLVLQAIQGGDTDQA